MVVTSDVSSAIVSYQDPGTGAPTDHHDPMSAAMVGGAFSHVAGTVVEGLSLTADDANAQVTVSAGVALLQHPDTVQVQTNVGGDYDRAWQGSAVLPVSIQSTTLAEDTSGTNYVYLDVDYTSVDTATVVVSSSQDPAELTGASLYLGTANTGDGSVNESAGDRLISSWEADYIRSAGLLESDRFKLSDPNNVHIVRGDSDFQTALDEISASGTSAGTIIMGPGGYSADYTIDTPCTIIGPGRSSNYEVYGLWTINATCTLENFNWNQVYTGPHIDLQANFCKLDNISGPEINVNAEMCKIVNCGGFDLTVQDTVSRCLLNNVRTDNSTFSGTGSYTVGVVPGGESADSDLSYK